MAAEAEPIGPIKITVVGEGAVGKTCLLIAYTQNAFPEDYVPTVFDNYSGNLVLDGKVYNLTLWDTAGQEEYERLRALAYPGTDCILLCYCVGKPSTLDNVVNKWHPEVRHLCPNAPIILVGTKVDLRIDGERIGADNRDFVSIAQGQMLQRRIKATAWMECSAKTRQGLEAIFAEAVRTVVGRRNKKRGRVCALL